MADDALMARTLGRSIVEKARSELQTGELIPATVLSFAAAEGIGKSYAQVHVAGDPPDQARQAEVLTGSALVRGQTVMLLFDPPEGAYVIGQMALTGDLPPCAHLRASSVVDDGVRKQPPSADAWWQSISMDPYLTVETEPSAYFTGNGHSFITKQAFDAIVTMQLETDLSTDGTGDGASGEIAIGFVVQSRGSYKFDHDVTYWEYIDGVWRRPAFPAAAQNNVGLTCSRMIRFQGPDIAIRPDIYQNLGYTKTFYWKLSVVALEPSTVRVLPPTELGSE